MKPFIQFMYKHFKKLYLLILLFIIFSLLNSYIQLRIPIISQVAIDNWVKNEPTKNELIQLGIKISVLVGLTLLFGIICKFLGTFLSQNVSLKIRNEMINHVQNLPLEELQNRRTGDLITRSVSDVEQMSEILYKVPESILNAILLLSGSIYTMYHIDLQMTLLLIIIIPFFMLINIYIAPKARKLQKRQRTSYGDMISTAENIISGVSISKANNSQTYLNNIFNQKGISYKKLELKASFIESLFRSSEILIRESFRLITIIFGGYKVAKGDITIGQLILFQALMFAFLRPIQILIDLLPDILKSLGSFDKLYELLQIHKENLKGKTLKDINGNITIKNLNFKYASNQDHFVLNDINLTIKKGEKIGIVGQTGCGKSTLCKLLVKFYPVKNHSIFIDDIDINTLSASFIRKYIGIVEQDVYLFAGTIRENLLIAKPTATPKELEKALIFSDAKSFIDQLPNQLDTYIGQRGIKLSGGQKQRISIARIFLQNPKILILDESTSALDNQTEKIIQKTLDQLIKNKTIISVAHRLSTIKSCDQIVVMNNGKISEIGKHEDLLKQNGIYKKLYLGS